MLPGPTPSPTAGGGGIASKEDLVLLEETRAAAAARAAEAEPEGLASPRDGRSVLEVLIKSPGGGESGDKAASAEPMLLHRSKLGRLSIIERSQVAQSALPGERALSPVREAAPAAAAVIGGATAKVGPTAVANYSAEAASKLGKGPIVTSVVRVQHVTLNPNDYASGTLAALAQVPPEWKQALQKQFGLPPNLQPGVKLAAYPSRIPTVLVKMHEYLLMSRVFETQVGIFRLAPDQAECQRLRQALDADVDAIDKARPGPDAACVANLIKVFFRELPVALFQCIPLQELALLSGSSTREQLERVWQTHLREPQRSIFSWLLDLCCDVTKHAEENKMTAKNLAICIGPNLYKAPTVPPPAAGGGNAAASAAQSAHDAMKFLQQCKHYTNFLELCIGQRELERGQKQTSMLA